MEQEPTKIPTQESLPFEEAEPISELAQALRKLSSIYSGEVNVTSGVQTDAVNGPYIKSEKISGYPAEAVEWTKYYRLAPSVFEEIKSRGYLFGHPNANGCFYLNGHGEREAELLSKKAP